jgi:hypothetical protein
MGTRSQQDICATGDRLQSAVHVEKADGRSGLVRSIFPSRFDIQAQSASLVRSRTFTRKRSPNFPAALNSRSSYAAEDEEAGEAIRQGLRSSGLYRRTTAPALDAR